MIKKSLFVLSMHKTATLLQEKIFEYISYLNDISYYKYFDLQQQKNFSNIKHPCIITDRFIETKDLNIFDVIIIIRHPVNRLISEYYSFGWTHPDNANWILNSFQREVYLKKFIKIRQEIMGMSLDEYVVNKLQDRMPQYNIALSYKECLVLPYEFMMSKPMDFFNIILDKINKKELSEKLYKKFKSEFIFSEDLSEDIVNGKSKSHKRVLNHKEYIEKLKKETIELIHEQIGFTLNKYNLMCKNYGLNYYDFNY